MHHPTDRAFVTPVVEHWPTITGAVNVAIFFFWQILPQEIITGDLNGHLHGCISHLTLLGLGHIRVAM